MNQNIKQIQRKEIDKANSAARTEITEAAEKVKVNYNRIAVKTESARLSRAILPFKSNPPPPRHPPTIS